MSEEIKKTACKFSNKQHIKAVSKTDNEILYFDTIYGCQKILSVNAGLIKMCCDGKNRVKSGKSKTNGKTYKFSYVTPDDGTIELIKLPKEKDFRKNKIYCICCDKNILSCRMDGHKKSKNHIKNLLNFDKIKNTT
jgi:hypothetical protein